MASFASQISFLLLFLLFATTLNKVMSCNENDQRLLLIFKHGVVDPDNKLSSWTVEEDCCLWEGVHCDNITGRVAELSLFNQSLRGDINLCLLQLEFLNHLDLSVNYFKTVSMPPCQISKPPFDAHKFHNQSLATPSNHSASFSVTLRYLNFSNNYDLVIKDLHWLSQLSSLKYLDLSESDIGDDTKWLQHIATLPSLSELHLCFCGLRDFPSLDYINLTSLEVLDLSENWRMKSKLPDSFFNITHDIYHLDLSRCSFYGQLPKALLNLQKLKHLDLGSNYLKGPISNWIGQYKRLQYLDIYENLFCGVIPSSLGNISSLFYLDLSRNRLSGNLPETLGHLHNLNHLGIGHNFLEGVLTENNFLNFSSLTSLSFGSTNLKFDIGPKWVPPFQVEHLDMSNTRIGPNVLTWLYTQWSLRYLDISALEISTIDADVFWSFIVGLDYVDISNNLISQDVSHITLSSNISYFYASHNSLTGSIFSLLCHLESNRDSKLVDLDLSYNHLRGALPDCWANRKQLRFLNLGSNMLTGKVPPSMASLMDLLQLDLSHNSFFGKFSLDLSNWTNLECLNLEGNKFSGTLPNTMQQRLYVLKLRGNQFIGNISPQLCNLTGLTILDLADNNLSGAIPHCLYNIMQPIKDYYPIHGIKVFAKGRELYYKYFSKVHSIDLSTNSLSGEIPKELFNLVQLWSLNLSRNHFIGKIPEEIGGMKDLESLDLSYNKLSGEIPSRISNLSFLSHLNLSYNNFTGQVPLGTQIQSFDPWDFVGNDLCGDPLPKKCYKKEASNHSKPAEGNEDDEFLKPFYLGMGVGFATGFWGVCGSLFLIRAWRHKFFHLFHLLVDRLYVIVALKLKKASNEY